jgi:hypothetical protein
VTVNLRGHGGGLRYGYADAVTFATWTLSGDEQSGFLLTATPKKVVDVYCCSDNRLTAWLPIGGGNAVWEWDGVVLGSISTSLSLSLRGLPRMKGAS